MDFRAICNALATRYAAANVTPPTNPATGVAYPNIKLATAQPPNAVKQFPTVIVFPDSGDLVYNPGQRRGEHQLLVNFYFARASGDLTRDWTALEAWLGVLIDQLHGASKLGLAGTVMKALAMKYEFGELIYAGVSYDGITITVHVWTEEIVTLVAA